MINLPLSLVVIRCRVSIRKVVRVDVNDDLSVTSGVFVDKEYATHNDRAQQNQEESREDKTYVISMVHGHN